MKLAVSGKGGVGKTTFSALLIRTLDAQGKRVLAIDADPDANLASALGIPDAEKIVPIAEMKDLIFERTEAQPGTIGGFFKLNPYRSGKGRSGGHGYGSRDRTSGQSHGICRG